MARKGGRARKSGARHPSGDIKQTGMDPIAPTLFQRIATEAKKHCVDPRLGTQLGRLFLHHELTSGQVAAGFRMARIYQDFERFKGKRRSPASPNYGDGGGDHSIAEELMGDTMLGELEERIREATEKFLSLAGNNGWIEKNLPRTLRDRLQELCVEDKYIGPITKDIRDSLDQLGLFFGFTSAKHATQAQKKQNGAVASTPTLRTDVRKPNLDRIYWIEVARRLRPDLDDKQLEKLYDVQRAMIARDVFRRAKPPQPKTVIEVPRVKVGREVLTLPSTKAAAHG